jgi:MoaA/NifB/PqqE/SkfB family radical SAM enzyme
MSEVGGPYSPLKIFHHPERLAALKHDQNPPAPVQIQAFISDFCQHDCGWCAFRWSGYTTNNLFVGDSPLASFGTNNPDRQIPFGKVIEILDDAKELGVKAIQYTGGGEPTVHPQHREIFQATLDRGLDLALVSNGSIFRKADAAADSTVNLLLRAQWVRFSMDAGTRETYASTRRINPALFEQFQRNVSALTEARRGLATRPPLVVGIGFVVNKDNWREVVKATEIARDIGADNLRISAVFQPDDDAYFAGFHAEAAALCREAESLSTPTFKVINRFGDRVQDLHEKHPDYHFCGYQYFNTLIGGDQRVWRCCNTAYHPIGELGSIKNQRFKDFWRSDELRQKMDGFSATGCPRCMFNGINRTINYALGENAVHVNFV